MRTATFALLFAVMPLASVLGQLDGLGACCLGNGTCLDNFTESQCADHPGSYWSRGTDCTSKTGACCIGYEYCILNMTIGCCMLIQGQYLGDGMPCTSACLLPPDQPTVTELIDAATGDKLIVKWSHSNPDAVSYYQVSYAEAGGTLSEWISVGGGGYYVLGGLTEHASYYVAMRACNEHGCSNVAMWLSQPVKPTVPVFLVHGIFDTYISWKTMADRLKQNGFNYVYAVEGLQLCGEPGETGFSDNARILSEYIEAGIETITNDFLNVPNFQVTDIDLIGHSMGGLVSRRYISERSLWGMKGRARQVRKLIMLGTPNKGSGTAVFGKVIADIDLSRLLLLGKCGPDPGPGLKEMWPRMMDKFNEEFQDNSTTEYYAVYGSRGSRSSCFFCLCYGIFGGKLLFHPNDGAVSRNSAVRDMSNLPGIFKPHYVNYHGDEGYPERWCHSAAGHETFNYLEDQALLLNYICPVLKGQPELYAQVYASDTEPDLPPQLAYTEVDSLLVGQSASRSLSVETNTSISIVVIATDPQLSLSLESPSHVTYDHGSTTLDSSVVYSDDGEGKFGIYIQAAEAGVWQWTLDAGTCTEESIPYAVILVIDNDIVVSSYQSSEDIVPDQPLTMNVIVTDGGVRLSGLTVRSVPVWNEVDTADVVDFYDDGLHGDGSANDGNYGLVLSTYPDTGMVDLYTSIKGTGSVGQIDRYLYTYAFVSVPGCCEGRVGDANGSNEPNDEVTLGDIMLMVDVKFISGDCSKLLCIAEADVNQDGGANPNCEDHVTLGDIMTLVDFLFITGPDVAVLPDCL